ncbi:hypothetical protein BKA81DRAFT_12749 [Phyllosticta paracitricarpa]|uniref:Secreted protein n=1 Tax=Phyllosticta citricarpa TaxID=55181 RepID=A0ABR1MP64_9PEZI
MGAFVVHYACVWACSNVGGGVARSCRLQIAYGVGCRRLRRAKRGRGERSCLRLCVFDSGFLGGGLFVALHSHPLKPIILHRDWRKQDCLDAPNSTRLHSSTHSLDPLRRRRRRRQAAKSLSACFSWTGMRKRQTAVSSSQLPSPVHAAS